MLRRRARITMAIGLGLALAACLVAPASAAGPKAEQLWSKTRSFRIPVTVPPENLKLVRELILWVSDDSGYSWKKTARTAPDSPQFSFRASKDGEFWFAVQTLDTKGKYYPNGDTPPEPTLKVLVDSIAPTIDLKTQGRRGSRVGVRWEVQDVHLLLNTMTLEYQMEGARDWRNVPLGSEEIAYIGAKTWESGTAEPVHARMTIRDQAGNSRSVEVLVPDGVASDPGPLLADARSTAPPVTPISSRPSASNASEFGDADPFTQIEAPQAPPRGGMTLPSANDGFPDPPPASDRDFDASPANPRSAPAASVGPTLLVPSPRFPLKYSVEDAGPDGPALVELWTTRDGGRTWSRQPADANRTSPYDVDLGGEGTFGLWLVVQSASGLGDPAPAPNDRPQSWVEVDSAPPNVTLDKPRVGTGANAGKVILSWRANDAHLEPKSVTLSYREDRADAPWVPIYDHQESSGKIVWNAPANVPPRFHLKAEAVDTLGNRGAAETTDFGPVLLDRARPRGKIIGLEQGAGRSRQ